MDKITVAICDDMESVCKYFENVFTHTEDIAFVGAAHNAKEGVELVREKTPDILLLDIQMETNDAGVNAVPKILEASPSTKIIMLSIHREEEFVFKALTMGAVDYRCKDVSTGELLKTVRAVHGNNLDIRPEIAEILLNQSKILKKDNETLLYTITLLSKLSTAEFEVLKDLCDGLSYKEIAKKRFVEEITVRSQVVRIVKKFDVSNIRKLTKTLKALDVFKIFR